MKSKKWIIWLSIIAVVLIGIYFVAGYFLGNLPIASKLLGTNKAKDLGVAISVQSAQQGLQALRGPLTAADLTAITQNPKSYTTVKTTLTDEQASSLLAIGDIPDFPFRNTQLKFGDGGKVQASGILDITKLQAALDDVGASGETVDKIMNIAKAAKYMPFYMEGTMSVTNNRVTTAVDQMQMGRINLPNDWVNGNSGSIADSIARTLTSKGYNIRKLTVTQGKIDMDMDRPLSSIEPWLKLVQ